MGDYFTEAEISAVRESLSDVSKVGINIDSHKGNDQVKTFFDKAKVWRVISRIIAAVYLEGFVNGLPFVEDKEGRRYKLVEIIGFKETEE